MSTEYLDIPNCPKCAQAHRYRLDVDRALIIKALTMSDMSERARSVRFSRLFTCPTKNEDFVAHFILTDTSSNRIQNVSLKGIAHGGE